MIVLSVTCLATGEGLRGLGRLTSRVSYLIFGSQGEYRVELDGNFGGGSIIIPLHVPSDAVTVVENALLSRHGQALTSLLTILGWGAVSGAFNLYKLFKEKRGRPLADEDDLARILATLENIERLLLIRIFNDVEVQSAIRAVLRSCTKPISNGFTRMSRCGFATVPTRRMSLRRCFTTRLRI